MRAIEIREPGGPEVLTPAMRTLPEPGDGELLICVKAAGVNRPDVLQRRGFYPPPKGASDLPGLEVAGIVERAGAGTPFSPGDEVMALLPGGGYAEYAVADAQACLKKPAALSFEEAAATPETLFTVTANVMDAAALCEGETLFVHGATSGIGTMAAAVAGALGAPVFGTAGTAEKCAAAEDLGYTACFNYRDADWAAEMERAGGADVCLDMVGGDYVAQNLRLLKFRGRHVSIAVLGGAEATIPILMVMQKQLILTGSTLRTRPAAEKGRLRDLILSRLGQALEAGNLRPPIDATFPLEDAAAAHARMEGGSHVGKIVLTL